MSYPPIARMKTKTKNSRQAADTKIGDQLRRFRESICAPRSSIARSIGIGESRLASYESGRVPLPYGIYLALWRRWHVSARFLAAGEGPTQAEGSAAERASKGLDSKTPFRQVY